MKKVKIFLASSFELKPEREQFEIEIYRKCKQWYDNGIFLHLDIWEDLSAKMSQEGSQSEYNKVLKDSDLFVLLVFTKVGKYSAEEFDNAFGKFQSTQKPFIYTYFKNSDFTENSVQDFKKKLDELKHFITSFKDFDELWKNFNKELDKLELKQFKKFVQSGNKVNINGDDNIAITDVTNAQISINKDSSQKNTELYIEKFLNQIFLNK